MTNPILFSRAACALLLVALAAPPLQAFDATGTWVGQFTCKDFLNGEKTTFKMKPSTLLITQNGTSVRASIDNDFFRYSGRAIDDVKKPDEKGEIFLVQCDTDNSAGVDAAEMVRAVLKTKPDKGTGSYGGLSIIDADFGDGRLFGTCKYKFKRTSTADPGVPACQI